ncbi:hypothetical protein [Pseudoalteromonas rubra]|nr:hypothetical protein [Pseudoalteromonas rubra]
MKYLAILLFVVSLNACASDTIEDDSKWAKEYMLQFQKGKMLADVYKVLSQKKGTVQFYNNCTEEFEYPMSSCEKGYGLVTTIKLPGHDTSLGKGDLQMYFTFNNQQQLVFIMHELYYPAHH